MKFVGYITSDPLNSGFVPHNFQNVTIKNFLAKKGHAFLLSWTEYKNHSQVAFNSLCEESYFQGICFYSWDQLDHLQNARTKLAELLERGIMIACASEGFVVKNKEELDQFLQNYFISRCIYQSDDLGKWLNERTKYL